MGERFFNYAPIRDDITVTIDREQRRGYEDDGDIGPGKGPWIGWYSNTTTVRDCLRATCTYTGLEGSILTGPNVATDQDYYITATVTNTSPDGVSLPASVNGKDFGLSVTTSDGALVGVQKQRIAGIEPGDTASVRYTLKAPSSPRAYKVIMYPDYHGQSPPSPNDPPSTCEVDLKAYQKFKLEQKAELKLLDDEEDPTRFNYRTYVIKYPSPAVYAPTTSVYSINGVNQLVSNGFTYKAVAGPDTEEITTQAGQDIAVQQPLKAGDEYCARINVAYLEGYVGSDPNEVFYDPSRPDLRRDNSVVTSDCETVSNKPYVHFLGADVLAGGGFGDASSCTNTNGGIQTYLKTTGGSVPRERGSGVQIGALSLGPVNGFSSAQLRSASAPIGPTGLSFSNTDNISGSGSASGTGGNLGGTHCVTDYFATKPAAPRSCLITT